MTALVIGKRTTQSGAVLVDLQVMGGAPETVFLRKPKDGKPGDDPNDFEVGSQHEVEVSYEPYGQGSQSREKDGKTYTDTFPTFRQRVYLVRKEAPVASARRAS